MRFLPANCNSNIRNFPPGTYTSNVFLPSVNNSPDAWLWELLIFSVLKILKVWDTLDILWINSLQAAQESKIHTYIIRKGCLPLQIRISVTNQTNSEISVIFPAKIIQISCQRLGRWKISCPRTSQRSSQLQCIFLMSMPERLIVYIPGYPPTTRKEQSANCVRIYWSRQNERSHSSFSMWYFPANILSQSLEKFVTQVIKSSASSSAPFVPGEIHREISCFSFFS